MKTTRSWGRAPPTLLLFRHLFSFELAAFFSPYCCALFPTPKLIFNPQTAVFFSAAAACAGVRFTSRGEKGAGRVL